MLCPICWLPRRHRSPQTNVKTMKSTNVEVSSKDLPTSSKNLKNDGRCAMSMGMSDVAPSGEPHRGSSIKTGSGQDAAFIRTDEDLI